MKNDPSRSSRTSGNLKDSEFLDARGMAFNSASRFELIQMDLAMMDGVYTSR